MKIVVEGYTDLAVADLKKDCLIKVHNGIDPVYFSAEGLEIKNLLTPSTPLSAVNRGYVTDAIDDLSSTI